MSQIIKIPLMKDHQDKPGYQSFIHDLNQIFNLQSLDPSNLKWVECEGPPSYNLTQPPNTFLDIGGNSPHININLYPMHDRNKVTGGTIYQAPLLMRDVSRWKISDLRDFKVNRLGAMPPGEEFLKDGQELPLKLFLEDIEDTTPVVDVVALLPISNDGSYDTEFCPQISYDVNNHRHYNIRFFMEGAVYRYTHMSEGTWKNVENIDHEHNLFNWKANFIPDMGDIEKLMLPSSAGHMIIIAEPYEKPKPSIDFSEFRPSNAPESFSKKVNVGDVNISQGSQTGTGGLIDYEPVASRNGTTTIFHIKYLGVRSEVAESLRNGGLDHLDGILGSFSEN